MLSNIRFRRKQSASYGGPRSRKIAKSKAAKIALVAVAVLTGLIALFAIVIVVIRIVKWFRKRKVVRMANKEVTADRVTAVKEGV